MGFLDVEISTETGVKRSIGSEPYPMHRGSKDLYSYYGNMIFQNISWIL
jgi:hypothetical protein